MNILIIRCKLSRFFRRACNDHGCIANPDPKIPDQKLDDIDNMYAGCAFE